MVAERWGESRDRDTRKGGVAARFRLLGEAGDSGDAPHPASGTAGHPSGSAPPEFGTAPWGYKRSEVDAWASWVGGLLAHARNETVRADSAEATLRATLHRLEQLESLEPDATAPATDRVDPSDPVPDAGPVPVAAPTALPRRDPGTDDDPHPSPADTADRPTDPTDDAARSADAAARPTDPTEPARTATPRAAGSPVPGPGDGDAPSTGAERPAGTERAAGTVPTGDGTAPRTERETGTGADRETARLHVVETTLRDVMSLLHRLVGPDDGPR